MNPTWVRASACHLEGTGVPVCTVIGFPLGATLSDVKAYEARRTIMDGAREVDMVINVGALKSGDDCLVEHDIRSVADVAHEYDVICKVIIEAALLTDDEKVRACQAAKKAGADFVKTSTGFSKGGATVADIALMRRVVGPELGVKASGGVKNIDDARAMVEAGATRIGASVGVKIAQEAAGAKSNGAHRRDTSNSKHKSISALSHHSPCALFPRCWSCTVAKSRYSLSPSGKLVSFMHPMEHKQCAS